MKIISWRLLFLITLLVGAFFYRFPVEIQQFIIETKPRLSKAVARVKSLVKQDKKELSTEESEPTVEEADIVVIRLKNKGQIEGIIEEESEKAPAPPRGGFVAGRTRGPETFRGRAPIHESECAER